MPPIPSMLARVPNLFSSQMMLSNLNRSSAGLLQLQAQMGTGLRVLRPSDDVVASATIGTLDDILERRAQQLGNLQQADSLLGTVDQAISEVNELILEAKGIGLSQIGIGSDAQTRANQAQVIDSILDSLVAVSNRDFRGIHFFGGQAVGDAPIQDMLGFHRYVGEGTGMTSDLGLASGLEVTLGAERVFGAMSARVRGLADLDPRIQPDTRISDLRGARGQGVELGAINVNVNGTDLQIDLSDFETIGEIVQELQTQIKSVDPLASFAIDPIDGHGFYVQTVLGPITISDVEGQSTAADLGLTGFYPTGSGNATGDLDVVLNELTRMDALPGLTIPMGTIRIENAGQVREADLSGVETVGQLVAEIEALGIGVRVEVDPDGRRLNFRNELSGTHMSISEVGGGLTATELGIRSFAGDTLLADFNDGRGVGSVSGGFDPITGLPDPALDMDFRITLGDGTVFDTDISGAVTVDDVLAAVNTAAAAAGLAVPGGFEARLAPDGNGIELVDGTGGGGGILVERLNNSTAAADLGILGSSAGAVLAGSDRAQVAADGLFTHLIALRDALLADDEAGIAFATEQLDEDVLRAAEARAEVGVRSRRVNDSISREEDRMVQDQAQLSEVRDLDFAEAATRYALLEQQLQASMMTISRSQQLSLLDFLR